MTQGFDRRGFLAASLAAGVAAASARLAAAQKTASTNPVYDISLAQWSLHKAFGRSGKATLDPLQFAAISAKDFGINAVEYVNQFYAGKKKDDGYLKDLKKVADDNSVRSVLIMCDGEGNLGDVDEAKRKKAVDNHKRWVEWAKFLGCHSIRVNASSSGTPDEQSERAADGLRMLTEFSKSMGINTIVENHGGLSSNGDWLAKTIKAVGLPECGTLPDFGNFPSGKNGFDRYKGVDLMMPFAKGVSAKSYDFNRRQEAQGPRLRRHRVRGQQAQRA
jgi:L-ribulose-5-phosphate 3-epimerase